MITTGTATGMVTLAGEAKQNVSGGGGWNGINNATVSFTASRCSSIYSGSVLRPLSRACKFFIKYSK